MGVPIRNTLAQRARRIARKRGLHFVTVETIIKDYLEDIGVSLENRERVVLDGLTSISIVKDGETGDFLPRGRVSPALKSRLRKTQNNEETKIKSEI